MNYLPTHKRRRRRVNNKSLHCFQTAALFLFGFIWCSHSIAGPSTEPATWDVQPDRYYEIRYSNKCLDVANYSNSAGGKIHLWSCHGGHNQKFRVVRKDTGYFEIRTDRYSFCLQPRFGQSGNGVELVQERCESHRLNNQDFHLATHGSNKFYLKNGNNGYCVDVSAFKQDNGTKIQQWDCNYTSNQLFGFHDAGPAPARVPDPTQYYQVRNLQSGKCWRADHTNTGAHVTLQECRTDDYLQQFRPVYDYPEGGHASLQFVMADGDKCLDVQGANSNKDAVLQLYPCHLITEKTENNQLFRLVKMDGRDAHVFGFRPTHSDMCIGVANDGMHNGARVHQWDCLGNDSQRFELLEAGRGNEANNNRIHQEFEIRLHGEVTLDCVAFPKRKGHHTRKKARAQLGNCGNPEKFWIRSFHANSTTVGYQLQTKDHLCLDISTSNHAQLFTCHDDPKVSSHRQWFRIIHVPGFGTSHFLELVKWFRGDVNTSTVGVRFPNEVVAENHVSPLQMNLVKSKASKETPPIIELYSDPGSEVFTVRWKRLPWSSGITITLYPSVDTKPIHIHTGNGLSGDSHHPISALVGTDASAFIIVEDENDPTYRWVKRNKAPQAPIVHDEFRRRLAKKDKDGNEPTQPPLRPAGKFSKSREVQKQLQKQLEQILSHWRAIMPTWSAPVGGDALGHRELREAAWQYYSDVKNKLGDHFDEPGLPLNNRRGSSSSSTTKGDWNMPKALATVKNVRSGLLHHASSGITHDRGQYVAGDPLIIHSLIAKRIIEMVQSTGSWSVEPWAVLNCGGVRAVNQALLAADPGNQVHVDVLSSQIIAHFEDNTVGLPTDAEIHYNSDMLGVIDDLVFYEFHETGNPYHRCDNCQFITRGIDAVSDREDLKRQSHYPQQCEHKEYQFELDDDPDHYFVIDDQGNVRRFDKGAGPSNRP